MVTSIGSVEGYVRLAAAIFNSGVRENDTLFFTLYKDWAKFLHDMVEDYVREQDDKHRDRKIYL